jgi:hypothetical protein
LVKNSTATVDRPWFYTFHGVVSATSGTLFTPNPFRVLVGLQLAYDSCNHRYQPLE